MTVLDADDARVLLAGARQETIKKLLAAALAEDNPDGRDAILATLSQFLANSKERHR